MVVPAGLVSLRKIERLIEPHKVWIRKNLERMELLSSAQPRRQGVSVPGRIKDADLNRIEAEIKAMPGYFADYDTTVHFITQAELDRDHRELPHGGSVIHTGTTGAAREHHCDVLMPWGNELNIEKC